MLGSDLIAPKVKGMFAKMSAALLALWLLHVAPAAFSQTQGPGGYPDRPVRVIVPVAALEQHGGHLPVFTDSMLLGEVVRRVETTMRAPG